jgi:hypothetical protein
MRKDIEIPKVTDVAVAVVNEVNELNVEEWNVYIVNLKNETIEGVLVSSRGYGEIQNEKRATSELRHFLDVLKPKSFKKIEPIVEDVFGLNNEYWVSFYLDKKMFDKKFIFLPETIRKENCITVPVINKKGVLIN